VSQSADVLDVRKICSCLEENNINILDFRRYKKALSIFAQDGLVAWKPRKSSEASLETRFQVIDFFSGCGGMSLGFAALSLVFPFFELIGGCDISKDPCCTYNRNFDVPCYQTDVRSLVEENALKHFMTRFDRYKRNKPLIVIGCPPCQGFTSHRKKNWDKIDHRNELVVTFARVAEKLQPECIVMENVPEMLSHKYWLYYQEFKSILEDAGYAVHQSIYNAASFGVPQERFRVIVIAMRHEFLLPELMIPAEEYVTVRQAIGNLPKLRAGEKSPTDPLHHSVNHKPETLKTILAVPKNGGNRPFGVGPKCLDRTKGFSDVYGRLFWDRPSITITQYSRNPASGRYVHPEQDRGLTMREAATLQSFPLGFAFCGSRDSIFRQIGEAVPPKMACAIASNVVVEMCSPSPTEQEKNSSMVSISQPISNSYSSVISKLKQARLRR